MTNPTPPDASPEMTVEEAIDVLKADLDGFADEYPMGVLKATRTLLTAFERQQALVEAADLASAIDRLHHHRKQAASIRHPGQFTNVGLTLAHIDALLAATEER